MPYALSRKVFSLLAIVVLLAGCASARKPSMKKLTDTLWAYSEAVRWGEFQQALGFVDPETLKLKPVTDFDLQRYKQVRVASYGDGPLTPIAEDRVRQIVELSLVNKNTQQVRTITDVQVWRYDKEAKRWWLESGLPDITQRE